MATEARAAERFKDEAQDKGKKLSDAMEGVTKNIKDTAAEFTDSLKEYSNDFVKYVKDSPLTSIGVAAAVGLLVGLIFKSGK